MRTLIATSLILCSAASSLPAQRDPASRAGGSFPATVALATVGASVGFVVGMLVAPQAPGPDDLALGSSSLELRRYDPEHLPGVLVVSLSTAVGASGGAMLGRHLTNGRQDVLGSLGGAIVGSLLGAIIVHRYGLEETLPIGVTISIPTAILSTLVGWTGPPTRP